MIFVSAYMGGEHGTAKSARDLLRALLASLPKVYVASPHFELMPTTLCGRQLSAPIWFGGPQGAKLPDRIVDWRPAQLFGVLRDRATTWRLRHAADGATAIVNGWGSHSYWLQMAAGVRGRRLMVVRESPRHFAGTDCANQLHEQLSAFAKFDALIFVSEVGRHEWLAFDELRDKASYHLPNCCEEEEVEAMRSIDRESVRRTFGFRPDQFVVLCPGTIEQRKGQDLVVELLPDLARDIPQLRVVFVGDPGADWGTRLVKELIHGEAAACSSYFRARPHILDLIYAADVLALPSRAEALPRTVLEAMALGTPVVAAAVDGVPELVDQGHTGILFPSQDTVRLREGLLAVASNRQQAAAMAENARNRYWTRFSRALQFNRLAEILDHVGTHARRNDGSS